MKQKSNSIWGFTIAMSFIFAIGLSKNEALKQCQLGGYFGSKLHDSTAGQIVGGYAGGVVGADVGATAGAWIGGAIGSVGGPAGTVFGVWAGGAAGSVIGGA
jgi:hypothetical protein